VHRTTTRVRHDVVVASESVRERPTIDSRTWFAIDGTLDAITFEGPSYFRFPEELARRVVDRFSRPGELVFDPFCGFGTTLVAAEALGRRAIGIEKDGERFEFASERVHEPTRVIHGSAIDLGQFDVPLADLVLTSPPYASFRDWDEAGFDAYWDDFDSILSNLRRRLAPAGRLVVEVSNVRERDGQIRPVAFESAQRLSRWYEFLGEIVRCNTSSESAGPGYNHAYLLVFAQRANEAAS
jgi:DNA modification methylase